MLSLKLKRTQWLGIFLFVLAVVVGAEPLSQIAVYEITEFKTYEFLSLFLEVASIVILGLFFILLKYMKHSKILLAISLFLFALDDAMRLILLTRQNSTEVHLQFHVQYTFYDYIPGMIEIAVLFLVAIITLVKMTRPRTAGILFGVLLFANLIKLTLGSTLLYYLYKICDNAGWVNYINYHPNILFSDIYCLSGITGILILLVLFIYSLSEDCIEQREAEN